MSTIAKIADFCPKLVYWADRDIGQGVKSLGGHFACLYRGFDFYEVKKITIIFQKETGNACTLLTIFVLKSLQKVAK